MSATKSDDLEALLQPTRFHILRSLISIGKSSYIDQIAQQMEEDPRLVSYHLAYLEENGLVESKFEVIQTGSSHGRAGRFYSVTEKGKAAFRTLRTMTDIPSGDDG